MSYNIAVNDMVGGLADFDDCLITDSKEDKRTAMVDYEFHNANREYTNLTDEIFNSLEFDYDDHSSSQLPPNFSNNEEVDMSVQPGLTMDRARRDQWGQFRKEYDLITGVILELPGGGTDEEQHANIHA